VVREKIKNFARIAVAQDGKVPPYKLVILDEADAMTGDAQSALRRTMESYAKVTRFCLICNYVSRIIEPLASRCAKFRFKPLDQKHIIDRLHYISIQEGLNLTDEVYMALANVSDGDLRRAITLLQSTYRLYPQGVSSAAAIEELAGVVPGPVIDALWSVWQEIPHNYQRLMKIVNDTILAGYAVGQILNQFNQRLATDDHLTPLQKAQIALIFGQVDERLVGGADESLQLMDLLMRAARTFARTLNNTS
jgi:replication factor C subunit 2/4